MIRVLHIHECPVAGMPYRMERLPFYTHPQPWETGRLQLRRGLAAMGFPEGARSIPVVEIDTFDIIHFHHISVYNQHKELARGKPVVVTIHGAPDRQKKPQPKGSVFLHTVHADLLETWPEARYIPNFILPDVVPPKPSEHFSSRGRVKPVLFQTAPHSLKNPAEFQALAARLGSFYQVVPSPVSSGRLANSEHLRLMHEADVVFDHLQGEFGLDTIETMACGAIPINACLSRPRIIEETKKFFGCASLPFFFSKAIPELTQELITLAKDPAKLSRLRSDCFLFWKQYWAIDRFTAIWREFYESCLTMPR